MAVLSPAAVQTANDETKEEPRIRSFNEIEVTLTFEDYEPMSALFKRATSEEQKKAKEAYTALTGDAEKEAETGYKSTFLSEQLLELPRNFPNYPYKEETQTLEEIQESFREYISRPEHEELLTWIYNLYHKKLYPKEIFSKPSA